MRYRYVLLFSILLMAGAARAQFSLNKGSYALDLGGLLLVDYNYKFDLPGTTDFSKDVFRLEDARVEIKGKLKEYVKFKLQFNLADLGASATDPTTQALMDAYMEIGPGKYTSIQLGYAKVPYGFVSLRDARTPFLQKPEFLHDQIMTRRALGITFHQSFWYRHINLYAGAYNPSGEQSLSGVNDPGRMPEVIGRLEVGYPSQYSDYLEVDNTRTPVPLFFLGLNARYSNTQTPGTDTYHLYSVDGKKFTRGADLNVLYKGFGLLLEMDQVRVTPANAVSLLPFDSTTYYMAGDFVAELSYNMKPWHSLLAVRYDELNPSDLVADNTTRSIEYAYTYKIPKLGVTCKLFYAHFLPYATSGIAWKQDEVRAGLEYWF